MSPRCAIQSYTECTPAFYNLGGRRFARMILPSAGSCRQKILWFGYPISCPYSFFYSQSIFLFLRIFRCRIPLPVTKGHIKGDKSSSLPTLHNYSFFFSSVRQSVPSCPCLSGLFPFPFSFLAFSSFSRRFPTHFRCVFSSLRCNVMTQDVIYILTYCKSIIYQIFSYIFAVTT